MNESDFFRVCIMGRYYDIPISEISSATLESLKSLVDESNNINPIDLLRIFLEYSEINNVLKSGILKANQKLQDLESQNQIQTINPIPHEADNIQEVKATENTIESLGEEAVIAQLAQSDEISNQAKSS
ncbi:hypothetical protein [Helicobacter sp.]|uniref:hypothetical protein n=1 Tax=Helicobacter sp. TaxID=218 RepID=UPI0025BCF214|nr:hypothetical protein [Helicobacter sp.]